MTALLVSVRDASEAAVALAAGAELIDVKEPNRGSLGAADAVTIREVIGVVAGRVPVSAALGELLDDATSLLETLPHGLAYAKFGLASCGFQPDWPLRWQQRLDRLPAGVAPVAVVYADRSAKGPSPRSIVATARRLGCRAVLLDTFDKTGGNLLNHWRIESVERLVDEVREAGMLAALAGGLTAECIELLLPLDPDVVAVRSAACIGLRTGTIDSERVSRLAQFVRERGRSIGRGRNEQHSCCRGTV